MTSIRNVARTIRAAKWEVLKAALFFAALLAIMMVAGYIATGHPGAGLAALLGASVLAYALYTIRNLLNWGAEA